MDNITQPLIEFLQACAENMGKSTIADLNDRVLVYNTTASGSEACITVRCNELISPDDNTWADIPFTTFLENSNHGS